ncbi:PREDICTED: adenomatous polyposis coli protein 2, partial [Chaetura pelagica]|uniref:adenomatous polyposis coli protein 2 n=1 Tax=Chaetura pelagica TaxID=8897 RepID=UPI000523234C
MSGSIASYEQLVRQVEALKKENSHLRRELEDNSNHLSKLENETSDMKEVLKHLQGKLEQEARVMVSSGQTEVLDQLKALQMDITSLYNLKFPPEVAGSGRSAEDSPAAPAPHRDSAGDLGRATIRMLEELDRERCFLLGEIEKEEEEKVWYYAQLQSLATRLEELPHVETFSMQMDLIRQQLEFEAQHIRSLMEDCGLQAVAELLQVDYEMHKVTNDPLNLALRRYAGMALTNLTFGDVVNKATLCSRRGCMEAIVAQLGSDSEDLHQVVSSILRNLSWRADINSKKVLREVGSVTGLTRCALHAGKGTLWNLSARSPRDQELLWDLGAVAMLRNLIHSKHKMIAMGSAAALRNLLTNRPPKYKDTAVVSPGSCMPSLYMRKQKALEAELDAKHLAETFDTMEKQSLKSQSAKKPMRHMESLVKDYASDSGCFDDDEVPNISTGVETASASVLSIFLNSSFLQGQALPRALAQRRCPEPEKDVDLQSILGGKPERGEPKGRDAAEPEKPEQQDLPERAKKMVTFPSPKALEEPEWKKEAGSKLSPDPQVRTIKLSPSYQHVPVLENTAKSGAATSASHHPSFTGRKQAWLPPALLQTAETLSKIPEKLPAHPPATTEQESVQKYSVEDTPICFSRCSSLSSLSSADNVLDGQSHSENDLDSDSSLEILEMEEGDGEGENGRQEKVADPGLTAPVGISQPITIPFPESDKVFLRESSPSRQEDLTPSSSSENYIQETPLVMSRCSSVSSLGSFESPSIASSIQSDPCSEMISGTVSPSELPDSPGQTMPPSSSKTPLFELGCQPEKETSQFNIQWENNVKKFMEITDFKERFQLPQDLDSMVYFTVEKPNENFSCASSLSALPLHEHYVQKDVELKLMPTFPEKSSLNFAAHEKREERREERYLEGRCRAERPEPPDDDDIEILKECISSAMPSRFRKVKTSLLSGQVLHPQTKKPVHVPVYMLVPAHAGVPKHLRATARDLFKDD